MNLFKVMISKFRPNKDKDEEKSGDLEEKKFTPITIRDADYRDEELEKVFAPYETDVVADDEIERLSKLAAKTKSKRIKKKLNKRIEKNT